MWKWKLCWNGHDIKSYCTHCQRNQWSVVKIIKKQLVKVTRNWARGVLQMKENLFKKVNFSKTWRVHSICLGTCCQNHNATLLDTHWNDYYRKTQDPQAQYDRKPILCRCNQEDSALSPLRPQPRNSRDGKSLWPLVLTCKFTGLSKPSRLVKHAWCVWVDHGSSAFGINYTPSAFHPQHYSVALLPGVMN